MRRELGKIIMKFGRRTLITFVFILLGMTLLVALLRPSFNPTSDSSARLLAEGYRVGDEEGDLFSIGFVAITLPSDAEIAGDTALVTLGGQPVLIEGQVAGDLSIIGGDVTLSEGSQVQGDAFIVGGQIQLLGEIDGDVNLSGDSLTVGETARIDGAIDACDVEDVSAPASLSLTRCAPLAPPSPAAVTFGTLLGAGFVSGLSALAVIVFPRQIAQMEDALRRRPLRLTGAGVALGALAVGISAALALLISALPPLGWVGVPLFLLMLLALGIMALFGGVPISVVFGDWLLARLHVQAPPLVAVLLGAGVISIGLSLLSLIPVVMWFAFVASLLLLALSVGTAFDTRLGRRGRSRSYFVQG